VCARQGTVTQRRENSSRNPDPNHRRNPQRIESGHNHPFFLSMENEVGRPYRVNSVFEDIPLP